MKRITSLLLVLLTLLSLTIPCAAADKELTISDAAIQQGETIYLRVSLNKDLKGDSIGVSFDFDETLLKALPKLSTWEKKGTLQDFNVNHAGVWASSSATNLKGDLCVLAFKVLDGAKLTETAVTCTVTIKSGSKVMGEYTAEATVSMHCDHDYDAPKDNGLSGHTITCKLCQKTITQSHNWTETQVIPNPNSPNTNLQVYTCSDCAAEKQVPITAEKENPAHTQPTEVPTQGTEPIILEPSVPTPETRPQETSPSSADSKNPNHDHTSDSNSNNDQSHSGSQDKNNSKPNADDKNNSGNSTSKTDPTTYVDYNSPSEDASDPHAGHNHAEGESHDEAAMIVDGNGIIETIPIEHDHDHDDAADGDDFSIGAAIAFAVLAVLMIGLPIYLIKGKKRI